MSCIISIIHNFITIFPRKLPWTDYLRKVQDRSSQQASNLDWHDALKNSVFGFMATTRYRQMLGYVFRCILTPVYKFVLRNYSFIPRLVTLQYTTRISVWWCIALTTKHNDVLHLTVFAFPPPPQKTCCWQSFTLFYDALSLGNRYSTFRDKLVFW